MKKVPAEFVCFYEWSFEAKANRNLNQANKWSGESKQKSNTRYFFVFNAIGGWNGWNISRILDPKIRLNLFRITAYPGNSSSGNWVEWRVRKFIGEMKKKSDIYWNWILPIIYIMCADLAYKQTSPWHCQRIWYAHTHTHTHAHAVYNLFLSKQFDLFTMYIEFDWSPHLFRDFQQNTIVCIELQWTCNKKRRQKKNSTKCIAIGWVSFISIPHHIEIVVLYCMMHTRQYVISAPMPEQ